VTVAGPTPTLVLLALLQVAGMAHAGEPPRAELRIIRASFGCAQGRRLHAVFDNRLPPSVSLYLSDGRQITLLQTLSGSGARYANRDETLVFWNKGSTAILREHGRLTYDRCRHPSPDPAP
jgi:membrane-bound inhibitor of C-type lysozyme